MGNLFALTGLCIVGYAVIRRSETARSAIKNLKHRAEKLISEADMETRMTGPRSMEGQPAQSTRSGKGPSRPHGDPLMPRSDMLN